MRHSPKNALFCRCGEPWGDGACSTACASCHRPQPPRGRVWCGECFHVWRWGWQLVLHDARTSWRVMGPQPWEFSPPRWWRRLHYRIRFRRPSKIWVCPCCSHDL